MAMAIAIIIGAAKKKEDTLNCEVANGARMAHASFIVSDAFNVRSISEHEYHHHHHPLTASSSKPFASFESLHLTHLFTRLFACRQCFAFTIAEFSRSIQVENEDERRKKRNEHSINATDGANWRGVYERDNDEDGNVIWLKSERKENERQKKKKKNENKTEKRVKKSHEIALSE